MAGADVNATNDLIPCSTALFAAAHHGHLEAVKLLIQHKAHPDIPNKNGTSAFMHACQGGHLEICEYLISLNVN
eukprot:gene29886-37014_t